MSESSVGMFSRSPQPEFLVGVPNWSPQLESSVQVQVLSSSSSPQSNSKPFTEAFRLVAVKDNNSHLLKNIMITTTNISLILCNFPILPESNYIVTIFRFFVH